MRVRHNKDPLQVLRRSFPIKSCGGRVNQAFPPPLRKKHVDGSTIEPPGIGAVMTAITCHRIKRSSRHCQAPRPTRLSPARSQVRRRVCLLPTARWHNCCCRPPYHPRAVSVCRCRTERKLSDLQHHCTQVKSKPHCSGTCTRQHHPSDWSGEFVKWMSRE